MWKDVEHAQRLLGVPELSAARYQGGRWHFFGDPKRRYPIASVTKTFTARAVELADIPLDARVRERLPDFRLHDPRATERMTVRDLLCHRSGLPPHTWAWVFAREARRDWIRTRLPHLAHVGPHDNAYRYSNIGYAVAGALLPGDWERFVQTEIIHKLGLEQTGFLSENWYRGADVAPPHKGGRGVPPFIAQAGHLIGPASELMSSAGDLARWLDHWRTVKTDCFTSQVRMGRDSRDNDRWYALGWRREKDLLWHTGSCTGYSAIVSIRVDRKEAMCILCNEHGVTGALEKLVRGGAVDAGDKPRVRVPRAGPGKGRPQSDLLGTWSNPGYGDLVFAQDGSVRFHGTPAGFLSGGTWRMMPYELDIAVTRVGNQIHLPLEARLDPIKFSKRD